MIDRFLKIIDWINRWIGQIFSFLIVLLTLLVVIEVFLRHFLGAPTIWSFEITKMVYGFYFMILGGYTLLKNAHVSVDVVYETLSAKTRCILDIISYLIFFFPFCTVLLIEGTRYANNSWITNEKSWSVFAPPLYPIKTVIPIAFALILLQGITIFIKKIHFLVKGN
jgi:TRAP-type mannitol/chloroaromatic compound transport system permease small subunit